MSLFDPEPPPAEPLPVPVVDDDVPAGVPAEAWRRGRDRAKREAIPSDVSATHILAVSLGPPWLEPRWPTRQTGVDRDGKPEFKARKATLHGGPYDRCDMTVATLGQVLTAVGEAGTAVYEYKEHDDETATYVAVEEA